MSVIRYQKSFLAVLCKGQMLYAITQWNGLGVENIFDASRRLIFQLPLFFASFLFLICVVRSCGQERIVDHRGWYRRPLGAETRTMGICWASPFSSQLFNYPLTSRGIFCATLAAGNTLIEDVFSYLAN